MKSNVKEIVRLLKKELPKNRIALRSKNALELLIATILSAQCTDVIVNKVTSSLFKKYKKAPDYADANIVVFEKEIRSTGFYKNKARNIISCCRKIVEKYKGKVPKSLDKLTGLPGVGRKTANVVLGNAFGVPGIVVDTHVKRISYRLGFTKNTDPVKIEFDLMKIIPRSLWIYFSNAVILHGRKTCIAKKPKCNECILEKLCPKKGL